MINQNDPPKAKDEVVDDTYENKAVEARDCQPEEGEIPDPQVERTDSSVAIPSYEIQEAQKCAILGLSLSDSDQHSRMENIISTEWGNEDEISKTLTNPEVAFVSEMEWK